MQVAKIRIGLVIYALLVHILCAVLWFSPSVVKTLKARLGWYDTNPSEFYTLSIPPQLRQETQLPIGSVLFFGDSIVEGWWRDDYPWPLANYGIGGDTAFGLRRRVSEYQRLEDAGLIVLSVGVNDLGRRSVDDVISHYLAIIGRLPSSVPILILSVSPVDERLGFFEGYNADIVRLNAGLKVLVEACERCHWLFIAESLKDETGNLATAYHSGDGLHLSKQGYDVWGRQVLEGIHRSLPQ